MNNLPTHVTSFVNLKPTNILYINTQYNPTYSPNWIVISITSSYKLSFEKMIVYRHLLAL
jgi:hypothetical protein